MDHTWTGKDKGYPGAVLPKAALGPALLFPEVEAMVGIKNNHGVVFGRTAVQCIEELPHLMIHKTYTGQVRLNQRLSLVALFDPVLGWSHMVKPGKVDSIFR